MSSNTPITCLQIMNNELFSVWNLFIRIYCFFGENFCDFATEFTGDSENTERRGIFVIFKHHPLSESSESSESSEFSVTSVAKS